MVVVVVDFTVVEGDGAIHLMMTMTMILTTLKTMMTMTTMTMVRVGGEGEGATEAILMGVEVEADPGVYFGNAMTTPQQHVQLSPHPLE